MIVLPKDTPKGAKMAVKSENSNCVIGEGSVFEGRFYVNGSILIEGKFEGDIKTDEQLVVGPTGKVKTDIYARKVIISGTLIGNIHATEEVNLMASGKVLGNISTPKLTVENGVLTEGKVTITGGSSEAMSKAIKDAFGEETEQIFGSLGKSVKKEKPRETAADAPKT
jgi:cytoskeletal protein CcmA (bactofilin family)